jgi:signal transduction histidine kinase
MKRRLLAVLLLFCSSPFIYSQDDPQAVVDSLKFDLEQGRSSASFEDLNKKYTSIGRALEGVNIDSAIAWYHEQLGFLRSAGAKHAKRDSLIGSVFLDISYLNGFIGYPTEEEMRMCIIYADSAYNRFMKSNYLAMALRARNNQSLAYINESRFELAIETLIEALGLSENLEEGKQKNFARQGIYLNIGKAYIGLQQWGLAKDYTQKAIAIEGIDRFKMIALNNLAGVYLELEEADSTLKYVQLSYAIADTLGDDYHKLLNRVNEAEALMKLNRFEEAIVIIRSNISLSEEFDYPYGIASGLNQEAVFYAEKGDYEAASQALLRAVDLAKDVADKDLLIDTYQNIEEIKFRQGQFEEAYAYQAKKVELRDSINSVQNTKNFNNLLLRYESLEKERQLVEQELLLKEKEADLAQRNSQLVIIIIGSILLLMIGLLLFVRNRQIQERRLQKALILEKERGLKAVLSATEKERKRISKDLHDGIGQRLTALRMAVLRAAEQSNPPQKENLEIIAKDFSESAEELRQISHQMMPKALMEDGLVQALEDLIEGTFKFSNIEPKFEYYKLQDRYPEQLEVSLFRIAQELLNNSLKHSEATEISVQLMEIESRLILIVEDNGKGLGAKPSYGQGLYNIKSRLDVIKGEVNYEPGPQTGMLATITIPLA